MKKSYFIFNSPPPPLLKGTKCFFLYLPYCIVVLNLHTNFLYNSHSEKVILIDEGRKCACGSIPTIEKVRKKRHGHEHQLSGSVFGIRIRMHVWNSGSVAPGSGSGSASKSDGSTSLIYIYILSRSSLLILLHLGYVRMLKLYFYHVISFKLQAVSLFLAFVQYDKKICLMIFLLHEQNYESLFS